MPTGFEFDTLKEITRISDSLDKIATELAKINQDGIRINKIDGLVFEHDCLPIVDYTKP